MKFEDLHEGSVVWDKHNDKYSVVSYTEPSRIELTDLSFSKDYYSLNEEDAKKRLLILLPSQKLE